MDNNKLKFTSLESEIFSLLCSRAGEKLSQREIAKILKVSPTAVGNSLKKLKENNFIELEKLRNINLISFNRNEHRNIELKRAENLKQIYLSGLAGYLMNNLAGATIILFGSYSKGEDSSNSDIDLAIIGRKEKPLNLEGYEKALNRKSHLLFFDSWKKINENLKNNILNGIVLGGSVEL